MCEMIVDLGGLSRNGVYDTLVLGNPVAAKAPGWTIEARIGGGVDLVASASRSVLPLSIFSLERSAPRRQLYSRGMRVGVAVGETAPVVLLRESVAAWRLRLSEGLWVLSPEFCGLCAHNAGTCIGHPVLQTLPMPHPQGNGNGNSGVAGTMVCYFCHRDRHDDGKCDKDVNTCVFCHVRHGSVVCPDAYCVYCTTPVIANPAA